MTIETFILNNLNPTIVWVMIVASLCASGYILYIAFKDNQKQLKDFVFQEELLLQYQKDVETAKDFEEVQKLTQEFIKAHPKNLTPAKAYEYLRWITVRR